MSNRTTPAVMAAAMVIASVPAAAVEGAVGRTLPGVWIQPQGAVVGPAAGLNFTTFPIGYMGAIGGAREIPEAGTIFANVEANFSTNWLVPQYVYKTETPKVSFASTALVPVTWADVDASAQVADTIHNLNHVDLALGDVAIAPLTVGIHFSATHNLALSTMVFAPTGLFRPGNLSNPGMG
jgi:hypothetical protein